MEQVNIDTLDGVLERYRERLDETRKSELYKWDAVRHFQQVYDPEADDFSAMLRDALQEDKKLNLLWGPVWYPVGMLAWFAGEDPEGTRVALEALFNEGEDLRGRMVDFEAWASGALEKLNKRQVANGDNPAKNHFQDTRSMSCYLAFMHPESNYYYKTNMYREAARYLGVNYPGNKFDKVIAYRGMCEQILARISEAHPELLEESDRTLRESAHGDLTMYDPHRHMLAQDVVYFITSYDKEARDDEPPVDVQGDEWFPSEEEYDPGIGTEQWSALIEDDAVFTRDGLLTVGRLLEAGGAATCTQLSQRFGKTPEWYNANSQQLARRVQRATGCPVMQRPGEGTRWWPILYVGRGASKDEGGSYVWRLRDDLREALERAGLPEPAGGEPSEADSPSAAEPYGREDFLSEVYMAGQRYDRLEALLKRKKNVILQGAPGVGKTFCARRLAWSMMGCKDDARIEMVQFHQSYTYEDFVMGWRPAGDGFELRRGVFHRFCERAALDAGNSYFFIIDEVNRGNLSKVFGELLMLIEADHRGDVVTLAYDGKPFCVPENVLIIGMMNTADRSLTGIDYALRRRFSFFEMEPAFGSEGFRRHQEEVGSEDLDALVDQIRALNVEITSDPTLGRGYRIGHSYLCGDGADDEGWLRDVVECDIVPMLEEYWFDDPGKARDWEARLLGALSQ